jgi:hypothetical protein
MAIRTKHRTVHFAAASRTAVDPMRAATILVALPSLLSLQGCHLGTGRASKEDSLIFTAAVQSLRDSVGLPLRVLAVPSSNNTLVEVTGVDVKSIASERSRWLSANGFGLNIPDYRPCDGVLRPPSVKRTEGCPAEHLVVAQLSLPFGSGNRRTVRVRLRNLYPYGSSESSLDLSFVFASNLWSFAGSTVRSVAE